MSATRNGTWDTKSWLAVRVEVVDLLYRSGHLGWEEGIAGAKATFRRTYTAAFLGPRSSWAVGDLGTSGIKALDRDVSGAGLFNAQILGRYSLKKLVRSSKHFTSVLILFARTLLNMFAGPDIRKGRVLRLL